MVEVEATVKGNLIEKRYWITAYEFDPADRLCTFATPEGQARKATFEMVKRHLANRLRLDVKWDERELRPNGSIEDFAKRIARGSRHKT
mgnify:CR=1 FL=1